MRENLEWFVHVQKPSRTTFPLFRRQGFARQNLRNMNCVDLRALSMHRALQMHQAGVVARRADLRASFLNALQFFFQHCSGNIGIFDGKRSAETATLLQAFQREQLDAAHLL